MPVEEGPILEASGLVKSFNASEHVLDGVDLTISAGEFVAITGRSGSGKSTLLLCLSGILPSDQGQVKWLGRRLGEVGEPERARLRRTDFGFIFQLGYLVEDLTSVDNVALPLRLAGVATAQARQIALDHLAELDLGELGHRYPAELSVGQAQRVAAARAMVSAPRLIFADEPTGSLDRHNSELVVEALTSAQRSHGAAILLVTHDLELAGKADRTIVLVDGRVDQT